MLQDDEVGAITLSKDSAQIGLIEYQVDDDIMIITHTEVDPAEQGKGYAGFLVRSAVELAMIHRYKPGATCPYAVQYFKRHDITNNVEQT